MKGFKEEMGNFLKKIAVISVGLIAVTIIIAVIHEAHESRGTGLTLCPTVILEKVKGDEARFLADCTYDKDIYFVDPKNFK